jgi:histidinol-phosphate aminotransferase
MRAVKKRALPLAQDLVRQGLSGLQGYVPGEQPKIPGLIKLNTNENPFSPSPKVLAAVQAAADGRLRLYPNPTAERLREKLARFHRCRRENIIVGNGSDELLAMATRAFVDPALMQAGYDLVTSPEKANLQAVPAFARSTIQYLTPSYSLYPVLAAIHGARTHAVPLRKDFGLPPFAELVSSRQWDLQAALTFITTPNAPSGRAYSTSELEGLCRSHRGLLLLDEAYVDFARENALRLALQYPHVLVARTFSKAYSLCFLRIGYLVGHPDLIAALQKIRDSYNVNGLGQIAAETTLASLPYYRANFRRIIATRERLSAELTVLGFEVLPSQTNFLLARPPVFPASDWLAKLRQRKILVRWFQDTRLRDHLRITIGTDPQANALISAARGILSRKSLHRKTDNSHGH